MLKDSTYAGLRESFSTYIKANEDTLPAKAWLSFIETSRHAEMKDFRDSYLLPKFEYYFPES